MHIAAQDILVLLRLVAVHGREQILKNLRLSSSGDISSRREHIRIAAFQVLLDSVPPDDHGHSPPAEELADTASGESFHSGLQESAVLIALISHDEGIRSEELLEGYAVELPVYIFERRRRKPYAVQDERHLTGSLPEHAGIYQIRLAVDDEGHRALQLFAVVLGRIIRPDMSQAAESQEEYLLTAAWGLQDLAYISEILKIHRLPGDRIHEVNFLRTLLAAEQLLYFGKKFHIYIIEKKGESVRSE